MAVKSPADNRGDKQYVYLHFKLMKMEPGIIIIGLLTIGVCTLPFILSFINIHRNRNQLLSSLNQLARQYHGKIHLFEICGNFIIGIDEEKNYLFFQQKADGEVKSQFIDLSKIVNCMLCNNSRPGPQGKIVERLALHLAPRHKGKQFLEIEFYNCQHSYKLNGELQLIEKWHKLINARLNRPAKAHTIQKAA
jgi:hypothetical protein